MSILNRCILARILFNEGMFNLFTGIEPLRSTGEENLNASLISCRGTVCEADPYTGLKQGW